MLNTAIESVEHRANSPVAVLVLKDFRHLVLEFPGAEEALDMVDALRHLSRPGKPHEARRLVYMVQMLKSVCISLHLLQQFSPSCMHSHTSRLTPSLSLHLPGSARLPSI